MLRESKTREVIGKLGQQQNNSSKKNNNIWGLHKDNTI